ncbi:MAG: caspase family protein, partial [Planctomycetaceae bacterium]|nr:caspase family protein [Planctomycetaceae bacterium]
DKEEVFKIAILDACRNTAPKVDGDIVKTADHTADVPDERLVARRSVKFRGGVITNPENVAFAEEDLMSFDKLVRFSSCRKGQQSLEDGKAGHGIFTKFVLEALSGKADEQTELDAKGNEIVIKETAKSISLN